MTTRARAALALAPLLGLAACTPEDEAELEELAEAIAWGIPIVFLSIVVAGLLIATAIVALVNVLRRPMSPRPTASLVLGILLVVFGLGAIALVLGARASGVGMHWGFFVEPAAGVVAGAASIVASSLHRRAARDPAALAGARAAHGVVIGAGAIVALLIALTMVGSALPDGGSAPLRVQEPRYAEPSNPLFPGREDVRAGDAERGMGESVEIEGVELAVVSVRLRRVRPDPDFGGGGLFAYVRFRATNGTVDDVSAGGSIDWTLEAPDDAGADLDAFASAGSWPFGVDLEAGGTGTGVVVVKLAEGRARATPGEYFVMWEPGICGFEIEDVLPPCRGVWRILTAADL